MEIRERLMERRRAGLRPVLNATGVVLHTNLGRAPLAPAAIRAVTAAAAGYSNLELDLDTGTRGSRTDHCRELLRRLTGAEDALVVNNAAGALVLALNAVAAGRDVLISRGELIEIGGSFRIPDIMARSGARLREVGTTNRTHLDDYRRELGPETGAVLTVHRSNFEQRGFVASPGPSSLAALAMEAGVPYLFDVGSGLLADLRPWGLDSEPRVVDALVRRRGPRDLQWGQAAGWPAGRLPRGGPYARRALSRESVRPRHAGGQADAGRHGGHARTVRRE